MLALWSRKALPTNFPLSSEERKAH
jgi:hypothetical protein